MSADVLGAIIGAKMLARLSADEVRRLAALIDAELQRDPTRRARLSEVVRASLDKVIKTSP